MRKWWDVPGSDSEWRRDRAARTRGRTARSSERKSEGMAPTRRFEEEPGRTVTSIEETTSVDEKRMVGRGKIDVDVDVGPTTCSGTGRTQ